jgi:hypothetical protein
MGMNMGMSGAGMAYAPHPLDPTYRAVPPAPQVAYTAHRSSSVSSTTSIVENEVRECVRHVIAILTFPLLIYWSLMVEGVCSAWLL